MDIKTDKKLTVDTSSTLPLTQTNKLYRDAPASFAAGFRPLHGDGDSDGDDNDSQAEISPSTPLLPSQLRKHHESLKLKARQEQAEKKRADAKEKRASQLQQSLSVTLPDQKSPSDKADIIEEINLVQPPVAWPNDLDDANKDLLLSPTSYHAQGALIRAKSYSMFESSPQQHHQHHTTAYGYPAPPVSQHAQTVYLHQLSSTSSFLSTSPPPQPSMDTRDWIKMQARINSLEQQVGHVSRTNQLLNEELDKVHGHLDKLTHEEGEGWRREYEFLVQQVDLMHRQLSKQFGQFGQFGNSGFAMPTHAKGTGDDGTGLTRMLQREVRDLSDSLRKWQAAYADADERYRKKLDGERVLKQTLQEREAQLIVLVDKLSGYEREFRKSISNYEELMRLSRELQVLEGKHPEHVVRALESATSATSSSSSTSSHTPPRSSGTPDTSISETSSTTSIAGDEWSALQAGLRKRLSASSSMMDAGVLQTMDDANVATGDHMPGTFPASRRNSIAPSQPPPVDHLSVSILSWAALLATYMMS
ncbi:hypothetical protein DFQ27_003333 [Actinomortierella ambigua]|uniref:Uncharacterized protein n=1 Tax=Actinomortierella ambigua TaxID=1343610 RepID=A0A9P6Q7S7_9FUNG|nr:hypothetical protein DFQ27_003333 [Actinomortierella ambigua]